jgi:hypothetical protein
MKIPLVGPSRQVGFALQRNARLMAKTATSAMTNGLPRRCALLAMTAGIRHCERSAAIHVPGIVIASEARQSMPPHRHCERSAAIHVPGTVIASAARQSMPPASSLRAQRGNPCPRHRHCERSAAIHVLCAHHPHRPPLLSPHRAKPCWVTKVDLDQGPPLAYEDFVKNTL